MADNYVSDGESLTLTAPSGGVVAGSGYLIGSLYVVALSTAAAGAPFAAATEGTFVLPKLSAQAWTEGKKVYWDAANTRCTSVATDGQLIGVAALVAANPSATGYVRLNGSVSELAEGPQAAITSLTDNSGGSADNTLAACNTAVTGVDGTASNAASKVDVDARLVTIANNLADLAAKQNAVLTALRAAGVIASS